MTETVVFILIRERPGRWFSAPDDRLCRAAANGAGCRDSHRCGARCAREFMPR